MTNMNTTSESPQSVDATSTRSISTAMSDTAEQNSSQTRSLGDEGFDQDGFELPTHAHSNSETGNEDSNGLESLREKPTLSSHTTQLSSQKKPNHRFMKRRNALHRGPSTVPLTRGFSFDKPGSSSTLSSNLADLEGLLRQNRPWNQWRNAAYMDNLRKMILQIREERMTLEQKIAPNGEPTQHQITVQDESILEKKVESNENVNSENKLPNTTLEASQVFEERILPLLDPSDDVSQAEEFFVSFYQHQKHQEEKLVGAVEKEFQQFCGEVFETTCSTSESSPSSVTTDSRGSNTVDLKQAADQLTFKEKQLRSFMNHRKSFNEMVDAIQFKNPSSSHKEADSTNLLDSSTVAVVSITPTTPATLDTSTEEVDALASMFLSFYQENKKELFPFSPSSLLPVKSGEASSSMTEEQDQNQDEDEDEDEEEAPSVYVDFVRTIADDSEGSDGNYKNETYNNENDVYNGNDANDDGITTDHDGDLYISLYQPNISREDIFVDPQNTEANQSGNITTEMGEAVESESGNDKDSKNGNDENGENEFFSFTKARSPIKALRLKEQQEQQKQQKESLASSASPTSMPGTFHSSLTNISNTTDLSPVDQYLSVIPAMTDQNGVMYDEDGFEIIDERKDPFHNLNHLNGRPSEYQTINGDLNTSNEDENNDDANSDWSDNERFDDDIHYQTAYLSEEHIQAEHEYNPEQSIYFDPTSEANKSIYFEPTVATSPNHVLVNFDDSYLHVQHQQRQQYHMQRQMALLHGALEPTDIFPLIEREIDDELRLAAADTNTEVEDEDDEVILNNDTRNQEAIDDEEANDMELSQSELAFKSFYTQQLPILSPREKAFKKYTQSTSTTTSMFPASNLFHGNNTHSEGTESEDDMYQTVYLDKDGLQHDKDNEDDEDDENDDEMYKSMYFDGTHDEDDEMYKSMYDNDTHDEDDEMYKSMYLDKSFGGGDEDDEDNEDSENGEMYHSMYVNEPYEQDEEIYQSFYDHARDHNHDLNHDLNHASEDDNMYHSMYIDSMNELLPTNMASSDDENEMYKSMYVDTVMSSNNTAKGLKSAFRQPSRKIVRRNITLRKPFFANSTKIDKVVGNKFRQKTTPHFLKRVKKMTQKAISISTNSSSDSSNIPIISSSISVLSKPTSSLAGKHRRVSFLPGDVAKSVPSVSHSSKTPAEHDNMSSHTTFADTMDNDHDHEKHHVPPQARKSHQGKGNRKSTTTSEFDPSLSRSSTTQRIPLHSPRARSPARFYYGQPVADTRSPESEYPTQERIQTREQDHPIVSSYNSTVLSSTPATFTAVSSAPERVFVRAPRSGISTRSNPHSNEALLASSLPFNTPFSTSLSSPSTSMVTLVQSPYAGVKKAKTTKSGGNRAGILGTTGILGSPSTRAFLDYEADKYLEYRQENPSDPYQKYEERPNRGEEVGKPEEAIETPNIWNLWGLKKSSTSKSATSSIAPTPIPAPVPASVTASSHDNYGNYSNYDNHDNHHSQNYNSTQDYPTQSHSTISSHQKRRKVDNELSLEYNYDYIPFTSTNPFEAHASNASERHFHIGQVNTHPHPNSPYSQRSRSNHNKIRNLQTFSPATTQQTMSVNVGLPMNTRSSSQTRSKGTQKYTPSRTTPSVQSTIQNPVYHRNNQQNLYQQRGTPIRGPFTQNTIHPFSTASTSPSRGRQRQNGWEHVSDKGNRGNSPARGLSPARGSGRGISPARGMSPARTIPRGISPARAVSPARVGRGISPSRAGGMSPARGGGRGLSPARGGMPFNNHGTMETSKSSTLSKMVFPAVLPGIGTRSALKLQAMKTRNNTPIRGNELGYAYASGHGSESQVSKATKSGAIKRFVSTHGTSRDLAAQEFTQAQGYGHGYGYGYGSGTPSRRGNGNGNGVGEASSFPAQQGGTPRRHRTVSATPFTPTSKFM